MGRHTIQKVINEVQAFEDLESIWNDSDDVIEVNFRRVDFAQASGALILSSGLRLFDGDVQTLRSLRPASTCVSNHIPTSRTWVSSSMRVSTLETGLEAIRDRAPTCPSRR